MFVNFNEKDNLIELTLKFSPIKSYVKPRKAPVESQYNI